MFHACVWRFDVLDTVEIFLVTKQGLRHRAFSQEHSSSWIHSAFFCDYPHNASCSPPDPQTLKIQKRWCVCRLCFISILFGHISATYLAYAMLPLRLYEANIIQVSWQAVSSEFNYSSCCWCITHSLEIPIIPRTCLILDSLSFLWWLSTRSSVGRWDNNACRILTYVQVQ